MYTAILSLLQCPDCYSGNFRLLVYEKDTQDDIKTGVVICKKCLRWHPIEHFALEFLPAHLSYGEDRKTFYRSHARDLKKLPILSAHPSTSSPQAVQQRYFDWYADNEKQSYTAYAHSNFWKATDALVFGQWKQNIRAGDLVLDVGCAQGRSTFLLSDLPVSIVGFDISKAMIRQAVKRYKNGKCNAILSFIIADATHFPFKKSMFDTVLLYGVLHHLADPAMACREIVRVLKGGGQYFGLENHQSSVRMIFDFFQWLVPIWYEKAGVKPLMTISDFDRWFVGTGMRLDITYRTFLPPHLINILPMYIAQRIVEASDSWVERYKLLKKLGGLMVIEGQKRKIRI